MNCCQDMPHSTDYCFLRTNTFPKKKNYHKEIIFEIKHGFHTPDKNQVEY